MPVEIRELVIRAVVADDANDDTADGRRSGGEVPDDLVESCVQEVLRVLKRSRER